MKTRRQGSWAGGAFAAEAPSLIPTIGALDLENLVLDDEGSLRRRGGCTYITDPLAALTALPLFLWHGVLAGGARTVLGNTQGLFIVDAAGTGLVQVPSSATIEIDSPRRPAVVGGILFTPVTWAPVSPNQSAMSVYAGSRKTAQYTTGTATVTLGSRTVTGAGTSWLANVDAGMLLDTGAAGYAVVQSVESNTSLTLRDPWPYPTQAGVVYGLYHHLVGNVPGSVLDQSENAFGLPTVAAVAGRLVVGHGNRFSFSAGPDPTYGSLRPSQFTTTDRHTLPDGADIRALAGLRDRLFACTTHGIFVASNMTYELVGPDGSQQHRIEHYSQDVAALEGGAGITTFRDALVVPAEDDIYLMDGLQAPEPITRSARREWREAVKAFRLPSSATMFRGHYVLPLVEGPLAYQTWLFRLDRPVQTSQGLVFPWSRITGQAGQLGGAAVDTVAGDLIGAGQSTGPSRGRVLNLSPVLADAATNAADANGTTVSAVLTTRDFVGGGLRTLWRFLRARYRLSDAGSTESLSAEVSTGGDSTSSWSSIGSSAPAAEAAQGRVTWPFQRMAEFVRFRLTATGGDEFVLHELEVDFEEPGR